MKVQVTVPTGMPKSVGADEVYNRRCHTVFGPVSVVWAKTEGRVIVRRLFLTDGAVAAESRMVSSFGALTESSCGEIDHLCGLIERFVRGEAVVFDRSICDFDHCSPFQRMVLFTEAKIPRGQVTTYRLLAEAVSSTMASRAVGHALATNPFPLIVPCHRTVRADGALGGFQGGFLMKRSLLEAEGVMMTGDGKVAPEFLPL